MKKETKETLENFYFGLVGAAMVYLSFALTSPKLVIEDSIINWLRIGEAIFFFFFGLSMCLVTIRRFWNLAFNQ